MSKKQKTWEEKLNNSKDLPKTVVCNEENKFCLKLGLNPGETVIIPSPIEVDELMKKIPFGKLTTINHIRKKLAKDHKTTIACPITTGIFAKIAAEASRERELKGLKDITPYWRTLKKGGIINEKYPGGIDRQKRLLEREGHKVIQKGKKYMVVNYEKYLFIL